jgi:hypothetical protein
MVATPPYVWAGVSPADKEKVVNENREGMIQRAVTLRLEDDHYVYSFNPALPTGLLEKVVWSDLGQNLDFARIVKIADGPDQVDLVFPKTSKREDVQMIFDRLSQAAIVDITLSEETYPSRIQEEMDAWSQALVVTLAPGEVLGASFSATHGGPAIKATARSIITPGANKRRAFPVQPAGGRVIVQKSTGEEVERWIA